ncbi:MAG: hypothetical protein JNN04_03230 [Cyclobacteriaceae bacterium]|nr:hypothetical protein [Cyclobacteriaceae bacterium]
MQVNKTTLIPTRYALKTTAWLALFALMAMAPSRWVKTRLAEGVTVSVPDLLAPMTPEDIAQRFPSVRAPLGAFTNAERLADFSVNISATNWPDGNVEMAQKFFKASLQNLYDRVDMISEGVQSIHKKKFIYFEFQSRISGERRQGLQDPVLKYTYIQYHIQEDRTLVFTFSCPQDLQEEWQPLAREMMKKVRVN